MKFLECVEHKFQTQLAGKPSRDGAPLELFTEMWETWCSELILGTADTK